MMNEKRLTHEDYVRILEGCLDAWNRADAELVASFYADDLEYRDPSVPEGITNKEDFIKYLNFIFKIWPQQSWAAKNVLPHRRDGAFTIDYRFRFANHEKAIQGDGIDRIEFAGEKIRLNHVYLNADKWKDWLKHELTGGR